MSHPMQLIVVLLSVLYLTLAQNLQEKHVVCYYTDWSVYRPGSAKFSPRDINPNICTHLIYSFAKFSDEGGIAAFDEWQDITLKGYLEFNEVKTLNENVKTLLAIGGWFEGSKTFSRIASLQDRRLKFADSVVAFLRKHNFDGINLDWQFPGFREGSREEDFENYGELVKDLKMVFENETKVSNLPRLMVTLSVPSALEYIEKGYDLLTLQKHADFINILCYDYHLSYDPFVNHHAPLYPLPEETGDHPNAKLNVQSTINYLLDRGMKREILNLGIPTFGRTFTLEDPEVNGLGATAKGQGKEGNATREKGYKAYYEVCKEAKNDNWTIVYVNRTAMGPYAYKGENWVGYDDEFIVRKKAEYARDMGLGGIMFWTIDDDDFRGECGSRGNPLIKAAREALLAKPAVPAQQPPPAPQPQPAVPPPAQPQAVVPLPAQPQPAVPPPLPAAPRPVPAPSPDSLPQPTGGQLPPPMMPKSRPPIVVAPPPPVVAPQPQQPLPPATDGSGVPQQVVPKEPIRINRQQQEGGNTYFQEITIWIVNNIFNINV